MECMDKGIQGPATTLYGRCYKRKGVVMFERRRRISRALHGVILPAVIHQLNTSSKGIGHLKVTKSLPDQAEVFEIYEDEEVRRHVVYLNEQSCTCREW